MILITRLLKCIDYTSGGNLKSQTQQYTRQYIIVNIPIVFH